MPGEELAQAFVGFSGIYGDRLFAFKSSARPDGFPYLTRREQEEMLLYRRGSVIRTKPGDADLLGRPQSPGERTAQRAVPVRQGGSI
jgi:uncharacterized protein